ncbi:hypothetical protein JIG36_28640 [Actinoplanes sp. LDG1-06]|uniref:ApeI dehydratase-like domain-containing protein n=1 Tax=Paractinoplanes ovalisporus TaxID=2810368 RepID=A0ABS2AI51_9ACTN|nr:hypothetical protein [Actinoplanes ovalisporus]MBM2619529.1 hypothetical protein [Actinoplanes ovalisporus]
MTTATATRQSLAGCSPVAGAVTVLAPGPTARTELVVAADEPVLAGHYPDFPIFPGVCLIECARLSAFVTAAPGAGGELRLAAVESARFRNVALPGDRLVLDLNWAERPIGRRLTARITSGRGDVASVRLLFHLGEESVAAAESVVPEVLSGVPVPPDPRAVLPHRYPILLVDRVRAMVPGESMVAVKAVSSGEPWFARAPESTDLAYPQVLMVESWAQSAGVLANSGAALRAGHVMLFGGASDVGFFGRVRPGDVLEHRVRVERRFSDTVIFTGESLVDGVVRMRVGSMTMAFRPSSQLTAARSADRAAPTMGSTL